MAVQETMGKLATCSIGVVFLAAQEEDVMSIIKNAEEETERCLKNLKVHNGAPANCTHIYIHIHKISYDYAILC